MTTSSRTVFLSDQPGYDPEAIRLSTRRMLEADGPSLRGKSVFLKPSFVYPARPPLNRGVNTQPEVVGGVAAALRDLGARRVWVAEDCLAAPSQAGFLAMGVLPYMRGLAEPVFLHQEPRRLVSVPEPLVEGEFRMPARLMDADVFISLPKIKVNMYATVTLSVKNHIGLLLAPDRLKHHHHDLHKKIADLYRTRLPDFVISDAIMAGEGQGPMHADPVPLNLLLGARSGLAADVVAARLMGYAPEEVEHLRFLSDQGLGPGSAEEVELEGAPLLEARARPFKRPRTDLGDFPSSLRFFVGSELACPAGCLGMIRGSLDRFWQAGRWGPVEGLSFLVGKPIEDLPADLDPGRTFVVGDCAEPHRDRGIFLPGCSAAPMAITWALARRGVIRPLKTRLRDLAFGMACDYLGLPLR
ncbi:MAG: DUF362 domain-containing protein [Polyangia bacterium]|nr:DUF362 domain-containing protein [Polyangia bacterium]